MLESEYLDTDVTSPAATFALSLMYMKTHNRNVARLFALPNTAFELDRIRHDFVLHRVVARALVLWHDILPSEGWIESMLPRLMTANALDAYFEPEASQNLHDIGKAHLYAVAGACLAMGLRFASTNNEAARSILSKYLVQFMHFKHMAVDGIANPVESFNRIDKRLVESVLCIIGLALGIVMAGSGHNQTFQLLECLRKRIARSSSLKEVASDIVYGDYMAITMAIGFVFLGGGQQGRYTHDGLPSRRLLCNVCLCVGFKTDNLSIACLLMAVFPQFPVLLSDNQVHLQVRQMPSFHTRWRSSSWIVVCCPGVSSSLCSGC